MSDADLKNLNVEYFTMSPQEFLAFCRVTGQFGFCGVCKREVFLDDLIGHVIGKFDVCSMCRQLPLGL